MSNLPGDLPHFFRTCSLSQQIFTVFVSDAIFSLTDLFGIRPGFFFVAPDISGMCSRFLFVTAPVFSGISLEFFFVAANLCDIVLIHFVAVFLQYLLQIPFLLQRIFATFFFGTRNCSFPLSAFPDPAHTRAPEEFLAGILPRLTGKKQPSSRHAVDRV
ncbi:MAG: hypothetical protein GYA23_09075 [Methanomicrobiales archaeon]|nr:hypothetical protein [Methanomicrobiales archaeon]